MKIGVSLPVRELADDLAAIKAFAQAAEGLGFSHLRVPDMVLRPGGGHLHEPMMLLAWVAAITERIQLVPSIIVLPSRQTALFAKQAAELDRLSGGRVRLGIGVGSSAEEYAAMGQDFHSRGRRCDEQLQLLKRLWSEEAVDFEGRWDQVRGAGLNPLPVQRPIPVWIGGRSKPSRSVIKRMGAHADGWFVLCSPDEFPAVKDAVSSAAQAAGRNPDAIGTEAGVAVVGPREAEWRQRVAGWRRLGLTHLCLRTLGGGLDASHHLAKLEQVAGEVDALQPAG